MPRSETNPPSTTLPRWEWETTHKLFITGAHYGEYILER